MIDVRIVDSSDGKPAKINGEGELSVVLHTHPPLNETVESLPFRQYFTDDGTSAGSNDMRVNGATTNADFYITASTEFDIYIKTVSVIIADAGATLNEFGNLTALTNGVEFTHNTLDNGTTTLHEGLKTNQSFVRLALGQPAFGTGTDVFKIDLSGGGADAYIPVIDMSVTFGLPWGLRLKKSSTDNLKFTIKDNLSTGIDQFDIIGYGIKI